jgi:hypothetical protein
MIYNLSDQEFTPDELETLNKDLNYVEPPTTAPLDEIIVGIECPLKSVPFEDRTVVRNACKRLLEREKRNKMKKSRTDKVPAMKKRGCVALKADKENAIVILREEQYSNYVKDLIEEGPYTSD